MIPFRIKDLVLFDFNKLVEEGFDDLVDPRTFLIYAASPMLCAKIAYRWAVFQDRKPTEDEFLKSIKGDDVIKMRQAVMDKYKDFCPSRLRGAITQGLQEFSKNREKEKAQTRKSGARAR